MSLFVKKQSLRSRLAAAGICVALVALSVAAVAQQPQAEAVEPHLVAPVEGPDRAAVVAAGDARQQVGLLQVDGRDGGAG